LDSAQYNLTKLWPQFDLLLSGDFTSPEGLSALFVSVLLALLFIFSCWSLINYWQAKNQIKFYRSLISGLTVEKLLEKRRDIFNSALENKRYGRLWREFDESLVHVPQKDRLCNTLDAAHFFNTQSISRGLTENRLLSAVPGFLTAIGVIGTFAGLQMGLSELNVTSDDFAELKSGIEVLIGGASIAFMTSVWGVFTSVIFNFFEKMLERGVRSSISDFQKEVDYLYPRITAEQSLTHIEDFSRQSMEKLAELDEKIGHKMQEAMQQASVVIRDGMEQSLNTILGPAIERLVDNAHSGSEKALESMMERFLEGIGSAGDNQRVALENAANKMTEASGGMSSGLNDFASNMDKQITQMAQRNTEIFNSLESSIKKQMDQHNSEDEQRQKSLTAGMEGFIDEIRSQTKEISDQNKTIMQEVSESLTHQIEGQRDQDLARQKTLDGQLTRFQDSQSGITESIDAVLNAQKQQNDSLFEGLNNLLTKLSALTEGQKEVVEGMENASTDMKSSSNQLGLLSANVQSAAEALSETLAEAAENNVSVAAQNRESSEIVQGMVDKINDINQLLNSTATTLEDAAEKAGDGLSSVNSHFDNLTKSLSKHVNELEEQISNLLSDYSERVQSQTSDRMNVWNEQTNSYIGAMTDAVRVINDVVDEIDSKVGRR
jgi:polyhydroxyalkanoate synthesis regulator phasin